MVIHQIARTASFFTGKVQWAQSGSPRASSVTGMSIIAVTVAVFVAASLIALLVLAHRKGGEPRPKRGTPQPPQGTPPQPEQAPAPNCLSQEPRGARRESQGHWRRAA